MSFPAGRERYGAVPLLKGFRLDNAAVVLFFIEVFALVPRSFSTSLA